jgi:hypothetical protein
MNLRFHSLRYFLMSQSYHYFQKFPMNLRFHSLRYFPMNLKYLNFR